VPGLREEAVSVEWKYMIAEAEYRGFLLRVQSTASPRRWRWFVTEQDMITKAPFNSSLHKAAAHGLSSSFEKAQIDAVAMVEAMRETAKS
jgi:hypothetical protein